MPNSKSLVCWLTLCSYRYISPAISTTDEAKHTGETHTHTHTHVRNSLNDANTTNVLIGTSSVWWRLEAPTGSAVLIFLLQIHYFIFPVVRLPSSPALLLGSRHARAKLLLALLTLRWAETWPKATQSLRRQIPFILFFFYGFNISQAGVMIAICTIPTLH